MRQQLLQSSELRRATRIYLTKRQAQVPGLAAALSTCRVAYSRVVDLEVTVSKMKLLTTVQVSLKLVGLAATISQGAADLWKTAMSGSV